MSEREPTLGDLMTAIGALGTEIGALGTEIGALRTEIGALRREMHTEIGTLRGEIDALNREMEANTVSILSDVAKNTASIVMEIHQLRDEAFVNEARMTRLEGVADGQAAQARAIAGLQSQLHGLAIRVSKLERGEE